MRAMDEPGGAAAAPVPAWLPNAITVLRIALIPVFLLLARECGLAAIAGEPHGRERAWAVAALVLVGASDVVDGWVARRWGLETPLGATLDAVADKLAQVAGLVFFAFSHGPAYAPLPLWFLLVILGRDVVMGAGWLTIRRLRGSVDVVHHVHGKLASFLVFGLLFWITADLPRVLVAPGMGAIAVLVVASTGAYFRDGWRQVGPLDTSRRR